MSFSIFLVDDSRLVRVAVGDMLMKIPDIEIIGEARNGRECLDFLESNRPDLIIMDVEMPEMDGIETLKEIKRHGWKFNILMLSVLTNYGALTTFRALDLGALDFLPKPSPDSGLSFQDIEILLIQRVSDLIQYHQGDTIDHVASGVAPNITGNQTDPANKNLTQGSTSIVLDHPESGGILKKASGSRSLEILLIGASTGGPPALQQILQNLPADFPAPILIVQHMPPVFTRAFADRLNALSDLEINEAAEDMLVEKGHVFIAPGNFHMGLKLHAGQYAIHLDQSEPRHAHRPSIDYTLEQIVQVYKGAAAALIMTGMGNDGVAGMTALHEMGGLTMAQDEASSIIFGMNRRAIEAGAVREVLPLDHLAERIRLVFCK